MEEFDETLGAIEDLFEKTHSLIGLAVLIPQTQAIIMHPFYTPESAAEFEEYLKRYCIENSIDHFYIASESWLTRHFKDDEGPLIPPSLDPKREEIIAVTRIAKDGDTVAIAPIIGTEPPARFLGNWKKQTENIAMTRWDVCLRHN